MPVTVGGLAGGTDINAQCSVPAPGEPVNSGPLQAMMGSAMTDLRTVKEGSHTLGGTKTFSGSIALTSRSVTRAMDGVLQNVGDGSVSFAGFGLVAADGTWQQQIRVPHGATITALTTYINPPNDGALPGTFPSVRLWKLDLATGTQTAVSPDTSDPNTTLSPYQAPHGFGPTGLSEVVDRTTTIYYAIISGEGGANKTAITWYGCAATYDVTSYDYGI